MATYSFINVQVSLTGPGTAALNLGYGAQVAKEGISVAMIEDKNSMYVGADGGGTHSLHAGRAAMAVIRLVKTSPTNNLLSELYSYQTSRESGGLYHGQNVITLTDIARGDSYTMSGAAFKKYPDNSWAEDAGVTEWSFDVIDCDPLIGAGIPTLSVTA